MYGMSSPPRPHRRQRPPGRETGGWQVSAPARRNRAAIAGSMGAGIVAGGIVLYSLMGREQAPELVGVVSALHAMAPSREEVVVTRKAVAPEDDGVLPERRSGSTELIQLR